MQWKEAMQSNEPMSKEFVYISGALAGAQDLSSRCRFYERFASMASTKGISVYLPHTRTHPEADPALLPRQVFDLDLKMIKRCSLLVAFLDVPSLGVGAEIALACEFGIPVLGTTVRGSKTSRFIVGLLDSFPHCIFYEYDEFEDLVTCTGSVLEHGLSTGLTLRSTELPPRYALR